MEISPRGWMSLGVGIISFFVLTIITGPIAIMLGLLTWSDGRLGKIGAFLGLVALILLTVL